MLKCGLTFLIKEKEMCSMLTTVNIPAHIDVTQFRHRLREKSIIIYEGKGCFRGKVFQVGNIGELTHVDIQLSAKGEVESTVKPATKTKVVMTNALPTVSKA